MSWFILAIIGHVSNGAAFVIDKALLSSAFKRSATYAGLVGLLSALVLVAAPFVDTWPRGTDAIVAAFSGITFVFALWLFFASLARGEASRIVPVVGSTIPILTLIGSAAFLGERLTAAQGLGFLLLVTATAALSWGGSSSRLTGQTMAFAFSSSALFAISSITGKLTYDSVGFLSGFVFTRIAAAASALLIILIIDPIAGRELRSMIRPESKASSRIATGAAGLAILGQSMGAVGFFFVQFAISKGSPTIVNALQAFQYAVLVLAAFVLRRLAPKLLGENLKPRVVIFKIIALAIAAVGLAFVV